MNRLHEIEELKKNQTLFMDAWISFQKRILERCPKLYKHLNHFEIQAGWCFILEKLSITLEALIPKDNEEMYALQVKEKFGTLRFYLSSETDEMSSLIEKAEKLSAYICEICGEDGDIRTNHGWLTTRCDPCHEEERGKL